MAIKLNSATLVDDFEYISLTDSALDVDHEDFSDSFEKYKEGMGDPLLKNGEEPTRFTLSPIADAQLLSKLRGQHERHGRSAFAREAGAIGIKSISGIDDPETGDAFKPRFVRKDGYNVLCPEHQNMLGLDLMEELGLMVLTHSAPKRD